MSQFGFSHQITFHADEPIDVGVFPPWRVIPTPTLLAYDDLFE
jgi:hypothetical protein